MNKFIIILFPLLLLARNASAFAPVRDNPYEDMYKNTENLEILVMYDEISVLEERYNATVSHEQSFANRMLGAAAIGAGGIGGMMLASGLAEMSADAAAEQDMAAYLATFKCDYGAGRNIAGGTTNVQLPGANVLLPLRNEYIALATDLQQRKEQLGLSPGIESNIPEDASSLYDNVSNGVTDGAYASVSRALTNPDGADAAEWDAQSVESGNKVKTGGSVGGAGVVGGAIGNILINHIK